MLSAEAAVALSPQRVDLPDGSFHATVHGTAAPTVTPGEDHVLVLIPVGGAEPVRCIVFTQTIDVANGLRHFYEDARQGIADIELRGMDAGFVGDTPYLDLQALYLAGPANARLLGHIKMRAFNVRERGVVCVHDQAGFVRTFDEATRPLLSAPSEGPRPDRYVVSFEGHPCGWSMSRQSTAAGISTDLTVFGYLLARSPRDLVASDDVRIDRFSAEGELVETRIVRNNNASESRYHVRRDGSSRRYRVEGRHLGRDIAGEFTAASPMLAGAPASRRAFQTLTAAGAPPSMEVLAYESGDPLAASTQSYRLERSVDARHAWIVERAGGLEIRQLLGADGIPDEVAVDAGGHALTFHRVTE